MIFDLNRRKLEVVVEHLVVAAGAGAYAAVSSMWTTDLDFFEHAVRLKLLKLAVNGAVQGLVLYRLIPSRGTSMDRRTDVPQIAKAAERLGIADPEVVSRVIEENKK